MGIIKNWLIKNWLIISFGLILTALSVRYASVERGYLAIGGEWLVLPILFVTKELVSSIREVLR